MRPRVREDVKLLVLVHARDVVDATLASHLAASDAVVAVPGVLAVPGVWVMVHAARAAQVAQAVLAVVQGDARHVAVRVRLGVLKDEVRNALVHAMVHVQPQI